MTRTNYRILSRCGHRTHHSPSRSSRHTRRSWKSKRHSKIFRQKVKGGNTSTIHRKCIVALHFRKERLLREQGRFCLRNAVWTHASQFITFRTCKIFRSVWFKTILNYRFQWQVFVRFSSLPRLWSHWLFSRIPWFLTPCSIIKP